MIWDIVTTSGVALCVFGGAMWLTGALWKEPKRKSPLENALTREGRE